MTNPYKAPESNIELPPTPNTPKTVTWAYVMIGLNWLFAQLDTLLIFFDDEIVANNLWALGGLTLLNVVIAWWMYQLVKQQNPLAWLLPLLLLLLNVVSLVSELNQTSGFGLFIYSGNILILLVLLVILFSRDGKAWLNKEDDGILG